MITTWVLIAWIHMGLAQDKVIIPDFKTQEMCLKALQEIKTKRWWDGVCIEKDK